MKMNRFCGLPIGVTIPPRFAAMACNTMTRARSSRHPAVSNAIIAMGTNASSATSLVTSIDEKNGSMISAKHTVRFDFSPETIACAIRESMPLLRNPATDAMRQNSKTITCQSMKLGTCATSPVAAIDAHAKTKAMHSTASSRRNVISLSSIVPL